MGTKSLLANFQQEESASEMKQVIKLGCHEKSRLLAQAAYLRHKDNIQFS
jgi:hypothetical protein